MRSPSRILFGAAIGCLLLAGCSKAPHAARADTSGAAAERKAPRENQPAFAPDFSLKDVNGTTVHLSDYKGKVVLLDFWATWCGPCKIEIPWFMEFEQQFKDRGFAVLGVSMDEGGWDDVKPYIQERKINYRILMANDDVTQAYTKVSHQIGIEGAVDSLPTTLLIDRSGRIATVHVGLEKGKNEIRDEIESLLGGHPAATSRALFAVPAWIAGAK